MDLVAAINLRRSRRRYISKTLNQDEINKIQILIKKYNQEANIRLELITNNGDAFNGLTRSYGMFSGVNNYVGMIANRHDDTAEERLGYYGELLVLNLTIMGLGSCFVGGSYQKKLCPFKLNKEEEIVCVIPFGYVEEVDSFREKAIRTLAHRKTKRIEEMYQAKGQVPKWFVSGLEAVQKAPSAINRQPVLFTYLNNEVSAKVSDYKKSMMAIDLGIAKLHFELGSGGGSWQWGNDAQFIKQ